MPTSHPWLAIGFVLLVSAAFASGSVAGRVALDAGASVFAVNLLRTSAVLVVLTVYLRARGVSLALPLRRAMAACALGVLIAAYSNSLFAAIAAMPVALAVVTFYTWPLMVGVGAWVVGTERLTWAWPLAAGAALFGLALALDVVHEVPSLTGTLFALAGALGWTVVLLLNPRVVGRADSRPVTFHMMIGATITNLVAGLITESLTPPQSAAGWAGLAGAVGAYCFAIVGTFIAVAVNGPVRTALIMNVEPVASLILSALLLGQVLSPHQVLGAIIVVGSLIVARRASAPATL
jgi:drug/metabolite transporter (DMT)-like permease